MDDGSGAIMGATGTRPGATGRPTVAVVIPWRDGGDLHRRAGFEYTLGYYEALAIGPVVVADDGRSSGHFNRHAAYNRGYAQTVADVVLWNEADTLLPREQIEQAVALAVDAHGLVVPYTERHELSVADTYRVYQGADPFGIKGEVVYGNQISIGQAGVTSRATMDAIGGRWDEGYEGWGYDDNAAFQAFKVLAGKPRWVAGKGVHLWHDPAHMMPSAEANEATQRNAARFAAQQAMSADDLRASLQG